MGRAGVSKINVGGELLDRDDALEYLRVFYQDAEQIAGEFHGMNRSEKFRINWPDEKIFVKANWRTFLEAARQMYAAALGDPKTPPGQARQMHLAIVLHDMIGHGKEADMRLQLAPGTQQFEGDKRENLLTVDKFGRTPNFRAQLAAGAAKILPSSMF